MVSLEKNSIYKSKNRMRERKKKVKPQKIDKANQIRAYKNWI